MNYKDINIARESAERDIKLCDNAVKQAAQLISGRLRSSGVWCSDLEELKRELKDYNIKTGSWKNR